MVKIFFLFIKFFFVLKKYRENGASLDCVWQINVPRWLSIAIFIEEFELASPNQCQENFIEIYSGQIASSPIKRYCGVMTTTHIYTSQHIVFLRFFALGAAQVHASHIRVLFSTYVACRLFE